MIVIVLFKHYSENKIYFISIGININKFQTVFTNHANHWLIFILIIL